MDPTKQAALGETLQECFAQAKVTQNHHEKLPLLFKALSAAQELRDADNSLTVSFAISHALRNESATAARRSLTTVSMKIAMSCEDNRERARFVARTASQIGETYVPIAQPGAMTAIPASDALSAASWFVYCADLYLAETQPSANEPPPLPSDVTCAYTAPIPLDLPAPGTAPPSSDIMSSKPEPPDASGIICLPTGAPADPPAAPSAGVACDDLVAAARVLGRCATVLRIARQVPWAKALHLRQLAAAYAAGAAGGQMVVAGWCGLGLAHQAGGDVGGMIYYNGIALRIGEQIRGRRLAPMAPADMDAMVARAAAKGSAAQPGGGGGGGGAAQPPSTVAAAAAAVAALDARVRADRKAGATAQAPAARPAATDSAASTSATPLPPTSAPRRVDGAAGAVATDPSAPPRPDGSVTASALPQP